MKYKTLHRKLKIEKHESQKKNSQKKLEMNSSDLDE